MKRLFGLPTTSPNEAVMFSFGLLYITQEIDKKRFIFLHKILKREDNKWALRMMTHLKEQNSGWAKNIMEKLAEYNLTTDWEVIKNMTINQWKEKVRKAVLKKNGEKLITNCTTESNGDIKINTKTRHIYKKLTNEIYTAAPMKTIVMGDKQWARTIFLSQNHMLECGKNLKSTRDENCNKCHVVDDEEHRLNVCKEWNDTVSTIEFDDIYIDDCDKVKQIVAEIEKKWELRFANGRMKK